MKFYVRGGIGDFLQSLWFILNNSKNEFIIHTHYLKAEEFFNSFNLKTAHYYYFNNIKEHDAHVDKIIEKHGENSTSNIKECPRAFYCNIEFSEKIKSKAKEFISKFKDNKPIIGIHPFGSNFSATTYKEFNLPEKFIPSDITKELISPDYNYIIFGSEKDFASYDIEEADNVLKTNMDILTCLETVKLCSKVIGTDSCFKAMSIINRIPTACLLGDFDDPTRDQMFINQYEQDGVLKVFRTKNVKNDQSEIISFFKNEIKNLSS